jgi:hypothetical protein
VQNSRRFAYRAGLNRRTLRRRGEARYDDIEVCGLSVGALWSTETGDTWIRHEVQEPDEGAFVFSRVVTTGDQLLVFGHHQWFESVTTGNDGPEPVYHRDRKMWRYSLDDGLPPVIEPPGPPSPSPYPFEDDYDAQLEVGKTVRYGTPIGGGCGSGYLDFNDRRWVVDES